jgi:hypothetical protein
MINTKKIQANIIILLNFIYPITLYLQVEIDNKTTMLLQSATKSNKTSKLAYIALNKQKTVYNALFRSVL